MVAVGKEGILYELDQTNLGKFDGRPPVASCPPALPDVDPGRDHMVDKFRVGVNQYLLPDSPPMCGDWILWPHVHGTPVFGDFGGGQAFLYVWPEKDHLQSFAWDGRKFKHEPVIATALSGKKVPLQPLTPPYKSVGIGANGMPGGMLSLSIDPAQHGQGVLFASLRTCAEVSLVNGTERHVWHECELDLCGHGPNSPREKTCNTQDSGMLRAFDPISLNELWNDQERTDASSADKNYKFAKFVPPTIARGRVFLATASNKVLVYGRR